MDSKTERLSLYFNAVAEIVDSHGISIEIYKYIRNQMTDFFRRVESKTDDVELLISGSSYDNLHMTRLIKSESGEQAFLPQTDFDYMIIHKKMPVLLATDKEAYLKARGYFGTLHPSKHPGYVKIFVSDDGRKLLKERNCEYMLDDITKEGFISNYFIKKCIYGRTDFELCGPAVSTFTNVRQGYSYDFLYALPVNGWPDEASEWITRDRPAGWPSQDMITRAVKEGCLLVPVGHYSSEEQNLEWRVSFTRVERIISKSLNEVQRRCYCLAKLLIKTGLPDDCILSSYHLKNIFFYMMENETKIKWVDENLGSLVVELFEETKQALIHRNIPNYFIRANNMISHRSQSEIEFTLAEMSKLISKPFTILSIICQKLQFYHKVAKYSHQLSEEKVENASCLELYSVLVTILYNMGMDKLTVIEMLSSRCFELICKINIAMRQFPRNGPVFTSESVPDLLIPSALKYCQLGKVNEALALHHVIYKNASQEHLVKYPQILTNLGCLYNVVASEGQSANAENRKECLKKAQSYFEKSQELNGASHEFAFTYANFLYSNKISISKALRYFQLASEIKPEPGKEIYINVDIPHVEGTKTEMIDSISASYYFLALCYHDMLDIYSERHILRKFAEVCERVPIDKRSTVLALCAICHASCGLRIKAEELAKECNKVESAVRTKNSKQGGSQFL